MKLRVVVFRFRDDLNLRSCASHGKVEDEVWLIHIHVSRLHKLAV